MAIPQPPGFPPAQPPRVTRSRAGGIMVALGGLATLLCVFVFTWLSSDLAPVRLTLWRLYQDSNQAWGTATTSDILSYQVTFYTMAVAGVLALLAGGLAAAVGARVANVFATLAGLLASFLTLFAPVYYYFRSRLDFNDLDYFFTELAGPGYFLIFPTSVFLFVATIVAFVGVFRAGRTGRPRPPGYPPPPGAHPPPPAPQPLPPQQPAPQPLPPAGQPLPPQPPFPSQQPPPPYQP